MRYESMLPHRIGTAVLPPGVFEYHGAASYAVELRETVRQYPFNRVMH